MKRTEFLNSLGLLAAGVLNVNQYTLAKSSEINDNNVRGIYHYEFNKVRTAMKEGDEVRLIRENDNEYYSFATTVYWQQHKMGNIAAYENIVLANMLDNDVTLNPYISQVQNKIDSPEGMTVEVYAELVIANWPLLHLVTKQNAVIADDKKDVNRR